MRTRALPLLQMQGATLGEDEPQAQSAPEYEFDPRLAWSVLWSVQAYKRKARSQTSCHCPGR